jgi:predicted RND superfamily exporter protein
MKESYFPCLPEDHVGNYFGRIMERFLPKASVRVKPLKVENSEEVSEKMKTFKEKSSEISQRSRDMLSDPYLSELVNNPEMEKLGSEIAETVLSIQTKRLFNQISKENAEAMIAEVKEKYQQYDELRREVNSAVQNKKKFKSFVKKDKNIFLDTCDLILESFI